MKNNYAMHRILTMVTATLLVGTSVLAQVPNISYPQSTYSLQVGTAITPIVPTNTGGAVAWPNTGCMVTTFAGSGNSGNVDGMGVSADFNNPAGIAADNSGNLYIADYYNNSIRKITPSGMVTTLAGNGNSDLVDGLGTAASFYRPTCLAVDTNGNVFVADQFNHCIRKITPAGMVTTFAGNGIPGYTDGLGSAASFYYPYGVAIDGAGNLYVADQTNQRIRKISPAGLVTTIAGSGIASFADGSGIAASFNYPTGIAVDNNGNVYVADYYNNRIRKIGPTGDVTTLAGNGLPGSVDGNALSASFFNPAGIFVDNNDDVYVAEFSNHYIRKISSAGIVTTIAGDGNQNYADGIGTSASFSLPTDLTVLGNGDVYVADQYNQRIRKIGPAGGYTISPSLSPGLYFNDSTGTITGIPTVAVASRNYIVTATNTSGSSSFTLTINFATLSASGVTQDNALTLSPNPSTGQAELRINANDLNPYQVRILDLTGRVLSSGMISSGNAWTFGADLAPGIYTIEAISNNHKLVQKWVKQ